MHKFLAACVAALIATAIFSTAAGAAGTVVNVRIEGHSETLFEGPLESEPHGVRASSDTIPAGELRRCDGINTNEPQNTVPALTPTAAAADAMTLLGENFDGKWYPEYEDYLVSRWGPDAQDDATGAYWGVSVNDVLTSVGGCQYQLDDGDEVVWTYDAFSGRPSLALFPEAAGYTSGPRPLTVRDVSPNQAVPLEVVAYPASGEGNPPSAPGRNGSAAYEGARIAPVATAANGSERIEPLLGQTANAEGKASVSFSEPGWHRVKATVGSPGEESVIRSNRLDICVSGSGGKTLEGASTCDQLPAADQTRNASPTTGQAEGTTTPEGAKTQTTATPAPTIAPTPVPASPGSLRLSRPKLDRRHLAEGKVTVGWTVLDPGPGTRRWTVSSRTLGRKHAPWVVRASGAAKTTATLRLPKGAAYSLRFQITDALGTTSTAGLGKVSVPKSRHRPAR